MSNSQLIYPSITKAREMAEAFQQPDNRELANQAQAVTAALKKHKIELLTRKYCDHGIAWSQIPIGWRSPVLLTDLARARSLSNVQRKYYKKSAAVAAVSADPSISVITKELLVDLSNLQLFTLAALHASGKPKRLHKAMHEQLAKRLIKAARAIHHLAKDLQKNHGLLLAKKAHFKASGAWGKLAPHGLPDSEVLAVLICIEGKVGAADKLTSRIILVWKAYKANVGTGQSSKMNQHGFKQALGL